MKRSLGGGQVIRVLADSVMFMLLVGVLLMSLRLFCEGYSRHMHCVCVNQVALKVIQRDIDSISTSMLDAEHKRSLQQDCAKEVQQLKDAQAELFDKSSVSFQYQFIQLILVVTGVGILRHIQSSDKQRQEVVENARDVCDQLRESTGSVKVAINNSAVLAIQSVRLHSLSMCYLQLPQRERDETRVMMRDFFGDISARLKNALEIGDGYEPELYGLVALDSVGRCYRGMDRIRQELVATNGDTYEIESVNVVCDMGLRLLDDMEAGIKVFTERYKAQWEKAINGPPQQNLWVNSGSGRR